MSTDPMDVMFDLSDSAYDELLTDAAKDDRIGNHRAVVIKAVNDQWKSGDARTKLQFILKTAGDSKADLTWSPPPPPDVYKAEKENWDRAKVQGVASGINLGRQLLEHYATLPHKIREGQIFIVKTAKNRDGFIRVIAFLPKDTPVGKEAAAAAGSDAPKSPF